MIQRHITDKTNPHHHSKFIHFKVCFFYCVLLIIDNIPSTIQIIYEPLGASTTKTISVQAMNVRPIIESDTRIIKDVVSYQRFGRIQNNPSYKCHLCGFSCGIKESLLNHFNKTHPHL